MTGHETLSAELVEQLRSMVLEETWLRDVPVGIRAGDGS
jgi:hypothetical protein